MKNAMSKASQTTWQTAISLYFGFKEPDCPLVFFFKLQERIKHSYLDFCCFYTFSFQLNHCISTFSEEHFFFCAIFQAT